MDKYLAKNDGETLLYHSTQVYKVSRSICQRLPLSIEQRHKLEIELTQISLLHDVGKAARGFQDMVRRGVVWGHRHEILSAAFASQIVPALGPEALLAIITHHRSIPEAGEGLTAEKCLPDNELPFITPNVFEALLAEVQGQEDELGALLAALGANGAFAWQPDGLNFQANTLGSLHEYWFRRQTGGQRDRTAIAQRREASLLRGLLMTADHLASAHQFDLPPIPVQNEHVGHIRKKELKGNNILPFQGRCSEIEGDAILKAPTGSGKTLGILLWAARNQTENGRLFYVLPHTASINAMHLRLQRVYGDNTVGVLHHKNAAYLFRLFEDDYGPDQAAKMAHALSGFARELYHPIRVTTPHQILRVVLQGKGWELGLAEFPNACFVFDEIHAFEPLLVGLTLAAVKWLKGMGAKVLFASATLPLFLERILLNELRIPEANIVAPDPADADDRVVLDKIRHRVEVRAGSLLSDVENIINEVKTSGQTTLIMCNHVATSQEVWKRMSGVFQDAALLHARFNSKDRADIEKKIQSDKRPRVLIATQAVEVSLDLDYDRGYTEPAPADALGQRLGRINRKGSRETPAPVVVYEEPSADSNGSPLYLPYDQETTKRTITLFHRCDLLTERELNDIVNEIYRGGYQGDAEDDYQRGLTNPMIAEFDERIVAGTHKDWVEKVVEGSDGQIEVLPSDLYLEFGNLLKEKRYLEARMLLVPVQIRQIWRLIRENVLYRDRQWGEYVILREYSSKTGLDVSKQIDNIM